MEKIKTICAVFMEEVLPFYGWMVVFVHCFGCLDVLVNNT